MATKLEKDKTKLGLDKTKLEMVFFAVFSGVCCFLLQKKCEQKNIFFKSLTTL